MKGISFDVFLFDTDAESGYSCLEYNSAKI